MASFRPLTYITSFLVVHDASRRAYRGTERNAEETGRGKKKKKKTKPRKFSVHFLRALSIPPDHFDPPYRHRVHQERTNSLSSRSTSHSKVLDLSTTVLILTHNTINLQLPRGSLSGYVTVAKCEYPGERVQPLATILPVT